MAKFCYLKTLEEFLPTGFQRALSAKGKSWDVGSDVLIAFMGGTEEQKEFVKKHAAEWEKHINLNLVWDVPIEDSECRISFTPDIGSFSYVGTDALFIPTNQRTLNFGWLDRSVVLHEIGHFLGLLHAMSNPRGGIDWIKENVYSDVAKPPNGWSKKQADRQIIFKESEANTLGTQFDDSSIMMYPIPDNWTRNLGEIKETDELSELDIKHIKSLYPFPK